MGAPSRGLLDVILQLVTNAGWLSPDEVEAAYTTRDRARTAALLSMLRDDALTPALRRATVAALSTIDDPRSYAPLRELVENTHLHPSVRLAAADALSDARCAPSFGEAWWTRRAEPVFEPIVIGQLTRAHESALLALLADPGHRYFADAISALTLGFEHPRFVSHVVDALSHPDAGVRRAAIGAVLYTEPPGAIAPLLALLDDADETLALDALEMLAWYDDSRQMLLGVSAFSRRTGNPVLRERAVEIVACVADVFAERLASRSEAEHEYLRAWLEPIWSLIGDVVAQRVSESDPHDTAQPPTAPSRAGAAPSRVSWCGSVADFCDYFGEIDRPFRPLDEELWRCEWSDVHVAVRSTLGDALLAWPDPAVRLHAPRAFAAWRDDARMLEVLDDPTPAVASAATYRAREFGEHAALAARLRGRFEELRFDSRAGETFESYVAVARAPEWHALAREILADREHGEDLRRSAAYALSAPSAVDVLREQLGLLSESPAIGWGVHIALLEAARKQGIATPELTHLREADDFGLQCEIAASLASR